jgi:hypothetical protein
MRRALALWLLLFGVYAATLKLEAYSGDEPGHLRAVETLARDGDFDAAAAPYGVGFPLLILPAYELAGSTGVELFLAALAALALTLAYRIALRAAPDPWALGASATVGLSAPLLAYATAVAPEVPAAAALAGAALLALRLDERAGWRHAFACFALLGALPWFGMRFVPAGVVIGVVAVRSIWRSRRRTLAIGSVEVALFSVALVVGIDESLYDTPLTDAIDPGGRGSTSWGWALAGWAPMVLLALAGAWWLWRSRRNRLARAAPLLHEVELAAGLGAAAIAVQLVVWGVLEPAGRHLMAVLPLAVPLVALGLRRAPRVGIALALLSVAVAVWVYADARWGDGTLATAASHHPPMRPTNAPGLSA